MYSPATYTVQAITEILAVKFIQWLKATLSRPAFLQVASVLFAVQSSRGIGAGVGPLGRIGDLLGLQARLTACKPG